MSGADAVIVGAGAAGIAAARVLYDAGLDILLVEAKQRIGGRAHSLTMPLREGSATLDLGCGWLHSARRNPWTALAEQYGLSVDRTPAGWGEQWRGLGFLPDEREAFEATWEQFEVATHAALDGPDRPLGDFVPRDDPWRPMIDAISGYANGARLDDVSLHDWAAYEDRATDDNWAVLEGYGKLVARHARGLPVRTGVAVTTIDHRAVGLRVETDGHGTITTRHVVVCVPTTVLAAERIRFVPALPAKHAAAAVLPLGLADKIFLEITSGTLPPPNAHLIGDPHGACTASYRLAPFGQPVVEGFLGGACAEAIENRDDAAAAGFAIDELVALLGSDWRARLRPLARTRWRHDAEIGGSYSHARVGAAGQRAVLAEPVENRIFFAGEACSAHDFSTAHGAYETGVAAARAVLAAHGGQRASPA